MKGGYDADNRCSCPDCGWECENESGCFKLLCEAFAIHDIKVIEGERGLFVAMPNKKMPNGEYRDVAHPIHSGMRAVLEEVILGEYYNVLKA